MGRRVGNAKQPCELLAEFLVGRGKVTCADLVALGAHETCGYTSRKNNITQALRVGLSLLVAERVVLSANDGVAEQPVADTSNLWRRKCMTYQLNPALAGYTDGRLMREAMAAGLVTKADTQADNKKAPAGWSQMFKVAMTSKDADLARIGKHYAVEND